MGDGSNPRTDIGVCLFLIVVCCAVLVEAAKLPPGSFEPMGSAPIPQATAGLIIFLCLVVMAKAARMMMRGEVADSGDDYPPRRARCGGDLRHDRGLCRAHAASGRGLCPDHGGLPVHRHCLS